MTAPPFQETVKGQKGVCPYCGSRDFTESVEEYEEIYTGFTTKKGLVIPGASPGVDEYGFPVMTPVKIPYYKPDVYPIVLQKNVSIFGRFLGDSDVDKIADQQNTTNRLSKKIIDRIVDAGTRVTLPRDGADLTISPKDNKIWRVTPEQKSCIDVYEFTGDLTHELTFREQVYQEARQNIGITDSFQGRTDRTANSGKAKQIAAAQSAGRLESKRVMKNAAYAEIYKLLFQFALAYADEPRPVVSKDDRGNAKYESFNRYDFLERDEAGEFYWNDQFLFSCDTNEPLANNRESMWDITTSQLQAGAFGDPTKTETLLLFWTKLELLHFPGASDTKTYLEKRLQEEQAREDAMIQQAQAAAKAQAEADRQGQTAAQRGDIESEARADAKAAVEQKVAAAQQAAAQQQAQVQAPATTM
jgi:hypothetical protein